MCKHKHQNRKQPARYSRVLSSPPSVMALVNVLARQVANDTHDGPTSIAIEHIAEHEEHVEKKHD